MLLEGVLLVVQGKNLPETPAPRTSWKLAAAWAVRVRLCWLSHPMALLDPSQLPALLEPGMGVRVEGPRSVEEGHTSSFSSFLPASPDFHQVVPKAGGAMLPGTIPN